MHVFVVAARMQQIEVFYPVTSFDAVVTMASLLRQCFPAVRTLSALPVPERLSLARS